MAFQTSTSVSRARNLRKNDTEAELRYDENRKAFLQAEGFHVMRCWNDDVFTNFEGVLDGILLRLTEQL